MRLDKYLKTARILKRREAAKELALQKRISINQRVAKPSSEVEIGDIIRLEFGNRILEVRVLDTPRQASKEKAALMFEVLEQIRIDPQVFGDSLQAVSENSSADGQKAGDHAA